MAVNNVNTSAGAPKTLSVEDFRNRLQKWFNEKGHLADFQSLLRQKMVLALQDTSLCSQPQSQSWCFLSLDNYAVTFLVAEFLFKKGYHYTLSVFTSEVNKMKNSCEFSPRLGFLVGKYWPWDRNSDASPRFQRQDVAHIMEALGFRPNSREAASVYDAYKGGAWEPLLLCIIQGVLQLAYAKATASKISATKDGTSESVSPVSPGNLSKKAVVKNETETTSPGTENILPRSDKRVKNLNVRKLLQKLKRERERELVELREELDKQREQALVELRAEHQRDAECVQEQHRLAVDQKEAEFRRQLLERETLIQAEIARHKAETRDHLEAAERARQVAAERERVRLADQTTELQHQKNEVNLRLRFLEDYMNELRQFEKNFQEKSEVELSHIAEQKRQLDLKQQQLDEGFKRLEMEHQAMESVQQEIEKSYRCLMQASASVGHTHGLKQELTHLRKELDAARHTLSCRSHTPTLKPSTPRCANTESRPQLGAHHKSQQTDPPPQEEQMALIKAVKHLREENCELHAYAQQLRCRIDELMLQAVHLTKQLENAHDALRVLSRRPAHTVPHSRERSPRHGVRAVVASLSSGSEDGSPTEDVLRQAKNRLRDLEKESEAVDRSYQRFRLRQSRSLPQTSLHDVLQKYRHGQHFTPHFQQQNTFPHSPRLAPVPALLNRADIASRSLGMTSSIPRREYFGQASAVPVRNNLRRSQPAAPATSTFQIGRRSPKEHERGTAVETSFQSNNERIPPAVRRQQLYSDSLRESSATADRSVQKTGTWLAMQQKQPVRNVPNMTSYHEVNTAAVNSKEGFHDSSVVVCTEQRPLSYSDLLESGTEHNVMQDHFINRHVKEPSHYNGTLGSERQCNVIKDPFIFNGVAGNVAHHKTKESLICSDFKRHGSQRDVKQGPSVYSDLLENRKKHAVMQEPFSYSDSIGDRSQHDALRIPSSDSGMLGKEAKHGVSEHESKPVQVTDINGHKNVQLLQTEPPVLKTYSDRDVSGNGEIVVGLQTPPEEHELYSEQDRRIQQENGVAERLSQHEESSRRSEAPEEVQNGRTNGGEVLEPQVVNVVQATQSSEASQGKALQGREQEGDPSPAASVHSRVSVESQGDKEMQAMLTEASLSSVALSSDQAISAGHHSKSDQDDDFW